ncbi:hypothetical protein D3C74_399050 [compost metagenome]
MQIGRRIYYEKSTGNVILDTGERSGSIVDTSPDGDILQYRELSDRVLETFDYVQLDYGQFSQDFIECTGFKVDINTRELEFSYPNESDPVPQEPVYQKPLTVEVEELKQAIADLTMTMAMMMA